MKKLLGILFLFTVSAHAQGYNVIVFNRCLFKGEVCQDHYGAPTVAEINESLSQAGIIPARVYYSVKDCGFDTPDSVVKKLAKAVKCAKKYQVYDRSLPNIIVADPSMFRGYWDYSWGVNGHDAVVSLFRNCRSKNVQFLKRVVGVMR